MPFVVTKKQMEQLMNLPDFGKADINFDDFAHNRPDKPDFNPPKSKRGDAGLEKRRAARKAYERARATTPPGEGSRFKALAASAEAGGAKSGAAVAAVAGRKKYGAKRFAKMAAAGRKR